MAINPEKEKALELALGTIEKQFGKGSIMRLGAEESLVKDVSVISTGSTSLDLALGVGGIPRGRIIEIYGPESSGKTTLCLHIVAEAQKKGGLAGYVDAEHALDINYARKLGVRTDDLLISQPDTGEQALEIAVMRQRQAQALEGRHHVDVLVGLVLDGLDLLEHAQAPALLLLRVDEEEVVLLAAELERAPELLGAVARVDAQALAKQAGALQPHQQVLPGEVALADGKGEASIPGVRGDQKLPEAGRALELRDSLDARHGCQSFRRDCSSWVPVRRRRQRGTKWISPQAPQGTWGAATPRSSRDLLAWQ